MAVTSPGVASAPPSTSSKRDPRVSRTRRGHCAIGVSGAVLSVFSSRHQTDALSVTVNVGNEALQLSGAMTPTQARSVARALNAAADSVERQRGAA